MVRMLLWIDDTPCSRRVRRDIRVDANESQEVQIIIVVEFAPQPCVAHVRDGQVAAIGVLVEQPIRIPTAEVNVGTFRFENALPFIAVALQREGRDGNDASVPAFAHLLGYLPARTIDCSHRIDSVCFPCVE